jgi:tRNA (mo5U34)-methyltransferase
MSTSEIVATVPYWRHRIELPGGVVTPGTQDTLTQLPTIGLPNSLAGQTVLDIGCSDGFYSFESERRGASRVLAVDNYSSVYIDTPRGFNVARDSLQSKVEFLKSDLFALSPQQIGTFDVVLFLGVLYHLRHPLLALEHLATLCTTQLILETEIAGQPEGRRERLAQAIGGAFPQYWMRFFPGGEISDPTTFWAPSIPCGVAMLQLCGFCGVKVVSSSSTRAVYHAFSPAVGDDVDRLIRLASAKAVASAASEVLSRTVRPDDLSVALKRTSIPEFGRIRQAALELKAKEWYQGGRPKGLPGPF